MDRVIHAAQELDRFDILSAAVPIGDPLSRLAREIEVEHRGDRIDAHPIDMIFIDPEEGVVDEEAAGELKRREYYREVEEAQSLLEAGQLDNLGMASN